MAVRIILNFLLLSLVNSQLLSLKQSMLSEDGKLTFTGLAAKYGYPAETYLVTTSDGYILTVFHQPGDVKRTVLLIHGNTPSADCWILRGNNSWVAALSERNYNIFSINLRGTRYSKSHVTLDPDINPKQFFNFSFYEQGVYDVPATIDFILKKTGQKQLTLMSHSVGTTLTYVMGSERPEYNEKIKVAVSLAPIAFLEHVQGIAGLILPFLTEFTKILSTLNIEELLTHDGFGTLLRIFCIEPLGYDICIKAVVFNFLGYDPAGFGPDFVPTFFGHYPSGSSRKTFEHLGQVRKRNRFANFDYGSDRNLQAYGTTEPPDFDLSKNTMKNAIFVGNVDFLGTVKDVERLVPLLANVVHHQILPYKKFNHADFVWGAQMRDNLFPYVFKVIEKYQ